MSTDYISAFREHLAQRQIPSDNGLLADGALHRYKTTGDDEANCCLALANAPHQTMKELHDFILKPMTRI